MKKEYLSIRSAIKNVIFCFLQYFLCNMQDCNFSAFIKMSLNSTVLPKKGSGELNWVLCLPQLRFYNKFFDTNQKWYIF